MNQNSPKPLADSLRPQNLDTFIGQDHLTGPGKPIRTMIKNKTPFSIIFWGPPGVGKTTLAKIIAQETDADFYILSAVSAGKADVRKVVEEAASNKQISLKEKKGHHRTILFLDEIHRFNKAQQDFLLPYVENGTIILIGATTENPSFSVISPLLSRTQVFVLESLSEAELTEIVKAGSRELNLNLKPDARDFLIRFSNGDARKALNLLEATNHLLGRPETWKSTATPITLEALKNALQSKFLRYDKKGEEHYDTISAFIKSMRASNPDAALYYLARMIDAGEDPLFIARRMVIFASEDIGLAQPTALVVANEVFRAVETIGLPEAQINLAHGVAYLSQAKKDRSSYEAYFKALDDVKSLGNLPIPMNLRNAPTDLMKELGYGKGYEAYTNKSLLPEKLKNKKYLKND